MIKDIALAFIPLFVAVDAMGVLPIFISLTEGLNDKEKRKIIFQSMATAICLAVGFVFLGKWVFRILNITVADFMISGGSILFCIAVMDLVNPGKLRRLPEKDFGAAPLGTPLIVGPAVLTTSLIIIEEYGLYPTLIAVFLNVMLAGIIFCGASFLIKILGEAGSKALSKVMALLLASIAVMMIRKGIVQLLFL